MPQGAIAKPAPAGRNSEAYCADHPNGAIRALSGEQLPGWRNTLRYCALRSCPTTRRVFVPGGCWFFTAALLDRRSSLLTDPIELLRETTRRTTQQRFPFHIDAMTILPDHIHAVWTLPPGDADFSVRWRWIKIRFARAI